MTAPAIRGAVVIDTDVYGADLVPGSVLATRYEPLIVGRPAFISFQTAAEVVDPDAAHTRRRHRPAGRRDSSPPETRQHGAVTDWRDRFVDESRVTWDRKVATAAGPLWPLARPYLDAWRYDSRSPEAQLLENHFRGLAAVPARHADAIDGVAEAVRTLFRGAGLIRLGLYRGQPLEPLWAEGDEVELDGRGLTAWTPLREVAVSHAARRRPGAVLATNVSVRQVALAFDPSSDAEVVLHGTVIATVDTLIP